MSELSRLLLVRFIHSSLYNRTLHSVSPRSVVVLVVFVQYLSFMNSTDVAYISLTALHCKPKNIIVTSTAKLEI